MNTGIYAITHAATGRQYVGSACNVRQRWYTHKSQLQRGCHANPILQAGWNKHGAGAYAFSVVEAVADVANLTTREQHFFDTLDPFYNILRVAGSSLGLKASDETRAKLSAAHKGYKPSAEHRAKMSAAHKGHKHSAETRARMSAAQMGNTKCLGHKQSAEHRAKISAAMKGQTGATP